MIKKVNNWMEFILSSAKEDGWFGPEKNTDRWPLAVGLKVLKQYYEGSGDERAMDIIKNYLVETIIISIIHGGWIILLPYLMMPVSRIFGFHHC